jgi:hypothetical protein
MQLVATRWSRLHPAARWTAVLAVAFAVLVLRRPENLLRAEFFYEDGQVFYVGAWFGSVLEQIGREYAGSFHVVPRIVAALERLVPVASAPLLGNAISLGIVAALAAYVASDRLSEALPDRRVRILLAVLLLVLPGSWETLGSITLIQWYLGLFLVFASLASRPTRVSFAAVELVAVAAASLTGPIGLLLAPLYWLRLWSKRDRWSGGLAGLVTAAGLLQLVVLLLSGERSALVPTTDGIAAVFTSRLWSSVIGGLWSSRLMQIGVDPRLVVVGSVALIAALLLAWRGVPRLARIAFAYAAAVIVASTLADQPAGFPASTYISSRYFLVPTACVALAVACLLGQMERPSNASRVAAFGVAGLFVLGIAGDLRLPPHSDLDWPQRSACIGGPSPCEVPVEFPDIWTIHWPGSAGTYVQPDPKRG